MTSDERDILNEWSKFLRLQPGEDEATFHWRAEQRILKPLRSQDISCLPAKPEGSNEQP
jgi:hypothetical protein